jgi:ChrR-like protein with cupin domain
MNIRFTALGPNEIEEESLRLPTRRTLLARALGLTFVLGSAQACRHESQDAKESREFFDPSGLPWHPAPGFGPGVWEQIVSGGRDVGATTRFLRFDPGSGNDSVVTHDFWEEIYVVSGTFESGGRAYPAGCVAVRSPGMPHGPFHSSKGCLNFEVRYRAFR